MKKKQFWLGTLAVVMSGLASLTGCLSYNGQLNTSVPMKEQVTIITPAGLDLVRINGNNVDKSTVGLAVAGSNTMRIPVGEHSLEFKYRGDTHPGGQGGGDVRYIITGSSSFTYEFETGYQYYAYPYTRALGRQLDPETAVIFGLSRNLNIAIVKVEKEQSAVFTAFESGVSLGLSKGPVNMVGLGWDICPFGVIFDAGKIALGLHTNLGWHFGWRPKPSDDSYSMSMPIDFEFIYGGLLSMYFNRNNGKAFGIGFGGGYIQALTSLLYGGDQELQYYNESNNTEYVDIYIPKGVWYLRTAVIFDRSMRFSLYFDYYLKNIIDEIPNYRWWDTSKLAAHPRNWANWGIGFTVKFL